MLYHRRQSVDRSRQLIYIRYGVAPRQAFDGSCCAPKCGVINAEPNVFRNEIAAVSRGALAQQGAGLFVRNLTMFGGEPNLYGST